MFLLTVNHYHSWNVSFESICCQNHHCHTCPKWDDILFGLLPKSRWQPNSHHQKEIEKTQLDIDRLSFYACGIQIRCIECIECIERHAFWLAKPSGASHIRNSIHSLYCMFCSSRVHYGQNSFKYLQNISPIIPWLSFVISIILKGHFVFWVMHFICSYLTLACYSNLA